MDDRMDEVIRVRVTSAEQQMFRRAAERKEQSLSAWLRAVAVDAATPPPPRKKAAAKKPPQRAPRRRAGRK